MASRWSTPRSTRRMPCRASSHAGARRRTSTNSWLRSRRRAARFRCRTTTPPPGSATSRSTSLIVNVHASPQIGIYYPYQEGFMQRLVTVFRRFLLVACAVAAVHAQVDTATIVGTVQDSSGAVVPGATVTATEDQTNIKTSTHADTSGNYVITALKVGN